jgi:hypothetical protein
VTPFDEFFAYNFERNIPGQKQVLQRMLQFDPDFLGAHALTVVMSVEQHDCATARTEADWLLKTYPTVPATQSTLAYSAACVFASNKNVGSSSAPFHRQPVATSPHARPNPDRLLESEAVLTLPMKSRLTRQPGFELRPSAIHASHTRTYRRHHPCSA